MKILIAYDGSKQADGAIADLSMAGLPDDADAKVVSVAEPWAQHYGAVTDPVSGGFAPMVLEDAMAFDEQARKNASDHCMRAIHALAKRFPRWKLSFQMAEGSPAIEILSIAESWLPDLIVLGSHGRSLFGRVLLGSVSQRVLHFARASVRITHGKPASRRRAPRLLIGFDGSRDGNNVVDVVASRNWPKGTSVRMVAVFDFRVIEGVPKTGLSLLGKGRLRILHTEWIKGRMTLASRKLASRGLRVDTKGVEGEARRMLLKQAAEWKADCIFAGSRGLSVLERFLIGSVSSGIAARADCTVEIVRAAGLKTARKSGKPARRSKVKTER